MLVVLKFSTKKKNTLITTVIVIDFELFSILSRRLFDLRSFNLKWYFNFYKISTQQHQRHKSSILVLHCFFLFLQLFIGSYKEELKCKTNKQKFHHQSRPLITRGLLHSDWTTNCLSSTPRNALECGNIALLGAAVPENGRRLRCRCHYCCRGRIRTESVKR